MYLEEASINSIKEIEMMSIHERLLYYGTLHDYCASDIRKKKFKIYSRLLANVVGLFMRKYKIEVRGIENIPSNDTVVFVCNHSNSHDFFTLTEVFCRTHKKVTAMAEWNDLDWLSRLIFRMGNVTFIKRDDIESKKMGEFQICNGLMNGISTIIFPESTWNLHPINAMLPIKAGPIEMSLISRKKIVPVIFEYIEVNKECTKESELYSKCIVYFGEPFVANAEASIFKQADDLQKKMEKMRHSLWNEFQINRKSLSDVDKKLYMNHLLLKKNFMKGFCYNSRKESSYIRKINGTYENEYYIDVNDHFVPLKF